MFKPGKKQDHKLYLVDLERASKFMYAKGLESEMTMQIGLTYNDMGTSLFKKRTFLRVSDHSKLGAQLHAKGLRYPSQSWGHKFEIRHDSYSLSVLVDTYRELKRFNLALSDYHYALDLGGEPSLIKARLSLTHYTLSAQCFNQQDYQGANIELSRAIDFFSNNPENYVNIARACMKIGMLDMAYKDIKKTLDLDPQHDAAASMLQSFSVRDLRKINCY